MRVPIFYNAEITDIGDIETLKQVTIRTPERESIQIPCDGLIFSGQFTGENTIAGASHLNLDPDNRIPLVDQNWITSDPVVSAIGNAVHPADMGDQCYLEGLKAGAHVATLLAGNPAPVSGLITVRHSAGIKMTTPSILRPNTAGETRFDLLFHVKSAFRGTVQVSCGERILYQKTRTCLPVRRIKLESIRVPLSVAEKHNPIAVTLMEQN